MLQVPPHSKPWTITKTRRFGVRSVWPNGLCVALASHYLPCIAESKRSSKRLLFTRPEARKATRRLLALLPEQGHNNENGNHCPRQPDLIVFVGLRMRETIVLPAPSEPRNGVDQQSKSHNDRRQQHEQRQLK